MQCHEFRCSNVTFLSSKRDPEEIKTEKEAIHSGHFMVSHFEAEAQDDEYEVAVPVPETRYSDPNAAVTSELQVFSVNKPCVSVPLGQLAIETSLTKLFQCMSLAYRQKLTSPKWNRFKGIRLRWKDKIRLNNVIWRCWHMQFIKKENTLICQFASPLDEGTHNKPEAVVLEGKYWKRKLAAVTAEYKKWRMFYRNKIMGWACKDSPVTDTDMLEWQTRSNDPTQLGPMMVDEDYMELMSDTLFSTISSNQPFAFPDTREIARGANLADFIQPSLVQLQPNLEDFMDTFEPLQEFFSSKLPTVPEDCAVSDVTYRPGPSFPELDMESQAPAVMSAAENAESSDFAVLTGDATSSYPPVESAVPSESSGQSSEIKTTRFYHSKGRTNPQVIYPAPPRTSEPTRFLGQEEEEEEDEDDDDEDARAAESAVISESYNFENDASSQRTSFLPAVQTSIQQQQQQQQGLKLSITQSKLQQFQLFHKSPPSLAASAPSAHYSNVRQNYDLAVTSAETSLTRSSLVKSTSLPSVHRDDNTFAVPKQMQAHKGRHRTRSGSSITHGKSKTHPPPLSSANSDSALNIPSALLAQLLTSNPRMYGVPSAGDRAYGAQTVTNVPILPMPVKSNQPNKILAPKPPPPPPPPHQSALLAAASATQKIARPPSSPDSPKDRACLQSMSPPAGGVAPPSTSPAALFSGPLSPPKEHRRVCHINAEQKRRYNIKNGFDILHSLIPHLHQNPNVKLSKAAMLQKGAEYIRQLQAERLQAKEDMEGLRYQIESLNTSISNCQSLLPATGAPVSRHRSTKMKEMFDEFVRIRTMDNWKFWIFSILFEPLLQSFSCAVSTASYDDLYRSTLIWVEQHCSLVDLRPAVLNSLRNLCTSTEILSDPSKLPEEARAAVSKKGI